MQMHKCKVCEGEGTIKERVGDNEVQVTECYLCGGLGYVEKKYETTEQRYCEYETTELEY